MKAKLPENTVASIRASVAKKNEKTPQSSKEDMRKPMVVKITGKNIQLNIREKASQIGKRKTKPISPDSEFDSRKVSTMHHLDGNPGICQTHQLN
jgi:hypothetical protein